MYVTNVDINSPQTQPPVTFIIWLNGALAKQRQAYFMLTRKQKLIALFQPVSLNTEFCDLR